MKSLTLLIVFLIKIQFSIAQTQTTISFPISTGNDDVELRTSNNTVDLTSSDLELHGKDGSNSQTTYLRFQNVVLPENAVVQSAKLIFTLRNNSTQSSILNIFSEIGNSAVFTSSSSSILNRSYSSSIIWDTPLGSTNNLVSTPNLVSIINFSPVTNTIGFKITGNEAGYFNVYSRNGSSSRQPKLEITYVIDTTPRPVTGINFNCNSTHLVVNTTTTYSANVIPVNATNNAIIWNSSNPTVASINSNGLVTALNVGTTTITATTEENSFSSTCEITVTGIPNPVIYKWSGALTPNSIKINAKLTNETASARALVSTNSNLSYPIYGPSIQVNNTTNRMGAFLVAGLQPNTQYYYAIESNGVVDANINSIGKFKTPSSGAHSYAFTVGSCNYDSERPVWQKIKEKNPLFMMVPGDLHYGNPSNVNASRTAYETRILNSPYTKALFNEVPIATVWDDHDFAGDNASSTSSNKNGGRQAYREYIPHYPFGEQGPNPAIYQSFVIGRVKYIMMDLRSEKTSTQICSENQIEWFKNECREAKANNQLIAWVSSFGTTSSSSDSWGGNVNYRTQRNAIFNFLRNENIQNLFIISGDAHMAGIDDGQNSDCTGVINSNNCPRSSTSTNPRYPILQSSPIYPLNISQKGIITNILPMTGASSTGQYTKVNVIDDGSDIIKVCFTVYRVNNSGVETILGEYCFERNLSIESIIEVEQVVAYNAEWKYYANDQIPANNWSMLTYNDDSWTSGNAPLGYGVSNLATIVPYGPSSSRKYITTYFRKNIQVNNLDEISNITLNARIDDGVVFYLNGTEIGRTSNIPSGQVYSTLATSSGDNGNEPISIAINPDVFKNALQEGNNVLSAEVHQRSASNNDIYFSAELIFNRNVQLTEENRIRVQYVEEVALNYDTTSVEEKIEVIETNLENRFDLYPNPSTGSLIIKNKIKSEGMYTLNIYTLSGVFVKSFQLNMDQSINEFNLSELTPQMYLILIINEKNVVFNMKWIKK